MSAPRRRGVTEADLAAWADYARHVRPLPGHGLADLPMIAPQAPPPPPPPRFLMPVAPPPRAHLPPLMIGLQPAGVDNASWDRFRTGRLPSMRKLDLHGRTAHRAFHSLVEFLRSAHADRLRVVEVVTGRGSSEGSGVIRREFSLWLNLPDLRPLVLGAAYASATNQGAVKLLLRRPR